MIQDLDVFIRPRGVSATGNIRQLTDNYPVFNAVMVIYHYAERIWRVLVTPNSLYNIYDHEKYYPGEPVNIYIYTIINKYYPGEKLGNYHQKRVRVNYHDFVVMYNR